MTETSQTPKVEDAEVLESQPLGKIEPKKVEANEVHADETSEGTSSPMDYNDQSLISATRSLLRHNGVRKSAAAIRDAVEMPHEAFGPHQAVSALSSLGFKSSFGSLKINKLGEDFFPLIAFNRDGSAVIVLAPPEDGRRLPENVLWLCNLGKSIEQSRTTRTQWSLVF
jgi:ATP-binding cassette subfamily C protein LapB